MTAPKDFIIPTSFGLERDEDSQEYINALTNFQRVLIGGNFILANKTVDLEAADGDDAWLVRQYFKKYAGKTELEAPTTTQFFKKVILKKIKDEVAVYLGTLDRSDPAQALIIAGIGDKLSLFSSDPAAKKKLMNTIASMQLDQVKYMFMGGRQPSSLDSYDDLGSLFVDKFIELEDEDNDPILAKDVKNLSIDQAKKLNVVTEASSIPTDTSLEYDDLSEEQLLNIRQCALVSSLINDYSPFNLYPLEWIDASYGADKQAFGGRIMPVVESAALFDPNTLVNVCTTSKRIKNFLLSPGSRSDNLYHKLFWVYTDPENNELRESEIYLTTNVDDFKLSQSVIERNTTRDRAKIVRQTMSNGYGYAIKTIDIDYNGTNPSTASKDVKVTLNINLDNLKSIDAVCSFVKIGREGKEELIELKLYDLVTLPATQTIETIAQGNSPIKREYSPEYSRIRLKVWSLEHDGDAISLGTSNTEDAMIIDLATIDHTLKRSDDASGKTSLTINYAGYFEQSMKDPYNDALAGDDIIMKRYNRRKEANDNIIENGCSDEIARDMFQIIGETDRIEAQDNINNGSIIKRLFENGRVYGYEWDVDKVKSNVIGTSLSPKQIYLTGARKLGNIKLNVAEDTTMQYWQDVFTNLKSNEGDLRVGEEGFKLTLDSASGENHFFYLGDLMYESLACLYQPKSAEMKTFRKNLNLRFVVGTFSVPDPNDITKTITINPVRIPVDMFFFMEWFHQNIISKGLTSYPVGLFIKDLTQRLINDIIYDTCFSILAPDETAPQLRASYFVDHRKDWFKSKGMFPPRGAYFDPKDPLALGGPGESLPGEPNILMTKNVSSKVAQSKNYCVIYQQFPSYFRQLKYERAGKLKDDPYTMTMYYGNNTKDTNYISNVSFSKTDSPHLREARYFNTNFGNLSLLSNVYDLSFDIKSPKAITSLYPGVIINFILTDWSGEIEHHFPQDALGESDPHKASTRANILGFGGYYVIKSVKYSLETNVWNGFKISVSTKFLGTDAIGDEFRRKPNEDKYAGESTECLTIRNSLIDRLSELEEATGIEGENFDRIYAGGAAAAPTGGTPSGAPTPARAPETSPSP